MQKDWKRDWRFVAGKWGFSSSVVAFSVIIHSLIAWLLFSCILVPSLLYHASYELQTKVQKYTSLAQKINANFLCDEENPLIESKEEQELAVEIEQDLNAMAECINQMRTTSSNSSMSNPGSHHQEVLIKRYHEILFDYSSEFKNTASTVNRKRESMELFQSSKNLHGEDMDSSVAKILRERSTIAASMKSINDVISQAFEARSSLLGQRASISSASSGLGGLTANVPSFARLIDGIQKKKGRESTIVSVVIGILLCITIWWIFLR